MKLGQLNAYVHFPCFADRLFHVVYIYCVCTSMPTMSSRVWTPVELVQYIPDGLCTAVDNRGDQCLLCCVVEPASSNLRCWEVRDSSHSRASILASRESCFVHKRLQIYFLFQRLFQRRARAAFSCGRHSKLITHGGIDFRGHRRRYGRLLGHSSLRSPRLTSFFLVDAD